VKLDLKDILNAERALIFRIVHVQNLSWILDHGVHCRSSANGAKTYVQIGNPELIEKRRHKAVPISPNGTLSDYVPFYFTPASPMLLNIKTGWGGIRQRANSEIAVLVSSLHRLSQRSQPFVFTDRHAYLTAANFFSNPADLTVIDWPSLQQRRFKKDPGDPEKFERYQAEALVHKHVPIDALVGIGCYNDQVRSELSSEVSKRGLNLQVVARPAWYF
jgi:hypothetical protein